MQIDGTTNIFNHPFCMGPAHYAANKVCQEVQEKKNIL
jgi:hypothetical protein